MGDGPRSAGRAARPWPLSSARWRRGLTWLRQALLVCVALACLGPGGLPSVSGHGASSSLWTLPRLSSGSVFTDLNTASGHNHSELILVLEETDADLPTAQQQFKTSTLISAPRSSFNLTPPGLYLGEEPGSFLLGQGVTVTFQELLLHEVAASLVLPPDANLSSAASLGTGAGGWSLSLAAFEMRPGSLVRVIGAEMLLTSCDLAQQLYGLAGLGPMPGFDAIQAFDPAIMIRSASMPGLELRDVSISCEQACGARGTRTLQVHSQNDFELAMGVITAGGCQSYVVLLAANISFALPVNPPPPGLPPTAPASGVSTGRRRILAPTIGAARTSVPVTVNVTIRGTGPTPASTVVDTARVVAAFTIRPPGRLSMENLALTNLAVPLTGVLSSPLHCFDRPYMHDYSVAPVTLATHNVLMVIAPEEFSYVTAWLKAFADLPDVIDENMAALMNRSSPGAGFTTLGASQFTLGVSRLIDMDANNLTVTYRPPTGVPAPAFGVGMSWAVASPLDVFPQTVGLATSASLAAVLNASASMIVPSTTPGRMYNAYSGTWVRAVLQLWTPPLAANATVVPYEPVPYGPVTLRRSVALGPCVSVTASGAIYSAVAAPVLNMSYTRTTWMTFESTAWSVTVRNMTLVGLNSPARWPDDKVVRVLDLLMWALDFNRLPSLAGNPPSLVMTGLTVSVSPQELDLWDDCFEILTGTPEMGYGLSPPSSPGNATSLAPPPPVSAGAPSTEASRYPPQLETACRSLGLQAYKAQRISRTVLQIKLLQGMGMLIQDTLLRSDIQPYNRSDLVVLLPADGDDVTAPAASSDSDGGTPKWAISLAVVGAVALVALVLIGWALVRNYKYGTSRYVNVHMKKMAGISDDAEYGEPAAFQNGVAGGGSTGMVGSVAGTRSVSAKSSGTATGIPAKSAAVAVELGEPPGFLTTSTASGEPGRGLSVATSDAMASASQLSSVTGDSGRWRTTRASAVPVLPPLMDVSNRGHDQSSLASAGSGSEVRRLGSTGAAGPAAAGPPGPRESAASASSSGMYGSVGQRDSLPYATAGVSSAQRGSTGSSGPPSQRPASEPWRRAAGSSGYREAPSPQHSAGQQQLPSTWQQHSAFEQQGGGGGQEPQPQVQAQPQQWRGAQPSQPGPQPSPPPRASLQTPPSLQQLRQQGGQPQTETGEMEVPSLDPLNGVRMPSLAQIPDWEYGTGTTEGDEITAAAVALTYAAGENGVDGDAESLRVIPPNAAAFLASLSAAATSAGNRSANTAAASSREDESESNQGSGQLSFWAQPRNADGAISSKSSITAGTPVSRLGAEAVRSVAGSAGSGSSKLPTLSAGAHLQAGADTGTPKAGVAPRTQAGGSVAPSGPPPPLQRQASAGAAISNSLYGGTTPQVRSTSVPWPSPFVRDRALVNAQAAADAPVTPPSPPPNRYHRSGSQRASTAGGSVSPPVNPNSGLSPPPSPPPSQSRSRQLLRGSNSALGPTGSEGNGSQGPGPGLTASAKPGLGKLLVGSLTNLFRVDNLVASGTQSAASSASHKHMSPHQSFIRRESGKVPGLTGGSSPGTTPPATAGPRESGPGAASSGTNGSGGGGSGGMGEGGQANHRASSRGTTPKVASGGLGAALSEMTADVESRVNENQLVIQQILGSGAFGTVYKALWKGLQVAVKTMTLTSDAVTQGRHAALMEAALSKSIFHPNVVTTYTCDLKPMHVDSHRGGAMTGLQIANETEVIQEWRLYIVQEFCDGGSLRHAIEARSFLSPSTGTPQMEWVLQMSREVAAGLQYLHEHNIIHGDLNPANVLLKKDDTSVLGYTAKIADFGLSVHMQAEQSHVSNTKRGTPFYTAPEVAHAGNLTRFADVFSYGVMLWELYCSRSCWTYGPQGRLVHQRGFPHLPPTCPRPFAVLVSTCMQPAHKQRPTFKQVGLQLDAMLRECEQQVIAAQGPAQGPPPPPVAVRPNSGTATSSSQQPAWGSGLNALPPGSPTSARATQRSPGHTPHGSHLGGLSPQESLPPTFSIGQHAVTSTGASSAGDPRGSDGSVAAQVVGVFSGGTGVGGGGGGSSRMSRASSGGPTDGAGGSSMDAGAGVGRGMRSSASAALGGGGGGAGGGGGGSGASTGGWLHPASAGPAAAGGGPRPHLTAASHMQSASTASHTAGTQHGRLDWSWGPALSSNSSSVYSTNATNVQMPTGGLGHGDASSTSGSGANALTPAGLLGTYPAWPRPHGAPHASGAAGLAGNSIADQSGGDVAGGSGPLFLFNPAGGVAARTPSAPASAFPGLVAAGSTAGPQLRPVGGPTPVLPAPEEQR
ncbi:hypothetical protein HYH03_009839 [Edaphochlamys debaryana]|uniref:Protein kinase domain-containing protein n=1 Tax=Edaphochlamys debaryana TaxID=47281 RepID=A0A835XYD2_9CHLO|nr:hypothetical protein HYH03_009839 [Edaphochlamys debaryana]|eukprot:KAG2491887.1 hypothetical protein HYH03_009839 [Edaphochlamys debaryana]